MNCADPTWIKVLSPKKNPPIPTKITEKPVPGGLTIAGTVHDPETLVTAAVGVVRLSATTYPLQFKLPSWLWYCMLGEETVSGERDEVRRTRMIPTEATVKE